MPTESLARDGRGAALRDRSGHSSTEDQSAGCPAGGQRPTSGRGDNGRLAPGRGGGRLSAFEINSGRGAWQAEARVAWPALGDMDVLNGHQRRPVDLACARFASTALLLALAVSLIRGCLLRFFACSAAAFPPYRRLASRARASA